MINISIIDVYKGKLDEEQLRLAALTVLVHQGKPPDTEINIVITDNKTIKKFNKDYLGHNQRFVKISGLLKLYFLACLFQF